MNFQLCRPAVTDPHKVRPCNYNRIVAPPYMRIPPEVFRPIYLEYVFGELAVTCTPLRMVNIAPHYLYFSCIYPQI